MTGARRDRNIKIGSAKKKTTTSESTGWSRPAEGRREIPRPRRHLRLKKLNLAVMMGVAIMTTVETTTDKVDARITAHRDLSKNHR